MNTIFSLSRTVVVVFIFLWATGCNDKVTDVPDEHTELKTIEHACKHMQDAGVVINADSTMPGPHLEEDDFEHTQLKVVLVKRADDSTFGYIHFGPAITSDLFVMTSEDVPLAITNRTTSGDTQLEIEKTFTAQQIADEADCASIKKAIIFEAQTGSTIIKIGPTTFDTVSVIIEEGSHEGSH